ncbi:MAG: GYF domain-containing protein [Muribaculaceae bacterium]|nr:GYF domain-containing protein [Muribaculaceae bacterium]
MMEKEYYIVVNDNREGPFSLAQLEERGIEPSTLVWTAGMADWARVDSVAELASILANRTRIDESESAFGSYAQPQQPYGGSQQPYAGQYQGQQFGGYNNPNQMPGYSNPPTNWKTLAIIATVVGFLFSCIGGIVGIFAITNASKAENAMRYGDNITAANAWSTCKTLCIVSFVLSGLGLVINILSILKIFSVASLMGTF